MRLRAIAALLAAVCLAGCTPRPAVRPPSPPPLGALPAADQLYAALAARRAAVRGLRALAQMRYTSPAESRRAKQLVVAERPDRLRFEVLSPFGAVFVLTATDGALSAYDRGEAVVYRGTASPENLERYAQVEVPVPTAVDLLLGTPPLAGGVGVVSADDGLVELWEDAGGVVQVAWFTPALDPVRYEERDADGRVRLRATFAEPAAVDGVRIPTRLTIELPQSSQRMEMALSEPEVNPVLPDAVFALDTPAGSREIDLDQAAP